ncbi:thioredoxin domain-containing protein [Sphingomonas ginkgonis]|nr:thioredoxin domain-containing protein [Sphingomonas ginkgonis]
MRPALAAFVAASLAAVSLAPAVAAPPTRQSAPGANWLAVQGATATGFRVGNPRAAHTLVEWGALNCPHCAHFAATVMPSIMAAVKAGRLQYEYRPIAIFPHDPAASLILRCTPARQKMAFIEDYYRSAGDLTKKLQAAAQDPKVRSDFEAAAKASPAEANRRLVAMTGMGSVAARHGVNAAAADRCVADPAGLKWIEANNDASQAAGVQGTPTFSMDGNRVEIGTPADLAKLLARKG